MVTRILHALLISLMALQLLNEDRKNFRPCYFIKISKNLMGHKVDTFSDFFSGRSNLYYLQYPANAQADKETSRQL